MLDVREGGKDERGLQKSLACRTLPSCDGGRTTRPRSEGGRAQRLPHELRSSLPSPVPTLFLARHSSPLYVQRFNIKDVNGFRVRTAYIPLSPAAAAVMRPPRRAGFGLASRVRPQPPLLMLLRWAEALLLLLLAIRLLPPRISADVAVVVLRIPPSAALVIGRRRRAPVMVDVTGIRRTRGGNFRAASLFKCYMVLQEA